jgi:hypothetical protein
MYSLQQSDAGGGDGRNCARQIRSASGVELVASVELVAESILLGLYTQPIMCEE